jgi:hypothetical protein
MDDRVKSAVEMVPYGRVCVGIHRAGADLSPVFVDWLSASVDNWES